MTSQPMDAATITLRSLEQWRDFEACVELQRETWGRDFSACVPAPMLMIAQKVGGVTAGAFDDDGHLLGFVFGLTGYRRGRPLHWSHMLAVRDGARDAGLGIKLKLYQRELLLENDVTTACWTFDPLVAKNAHINLNRLGAVVIEHVESMYGESNSPLHAGLGTDRFVAEWRLADERVARVIAGRAPPGVTAFARSPVVNDTPRQSPVSAARVRIEIPADIYEVLERAPQQAAEWRARTRGALQTYLAKGYRVTAFMRDAKTGRCFYGLAAG